MRPRSLLPLAALLACGGAHSGFGADHTNDGGDGAPGMFEAGGPPPMLSKDGPSGTSSVMCGEAAKLVYVIDDQGILHSFDPSTLVFKTIGATSCPGATKTNSMAIDRLATAWVNDENGEIYKVDTANASCETTLFAPGQYGFENQLGMGFSANTPGGSDETLYVDGVGGHGLATIDLTTMFLHPIAPFGSGMASRDCELTGTGSALLYGFFTSNPASVAGIDKTTAAILSNAPQPGVDTGTDWAFSFWGGSFYLYTADVSQNPLDTSNVTQYDPVAGTTKVVLAEVGFRIVGAGVSTCAPVTPPPLK